MVLNTSLLNTQHYKVRIKGKVGIMKFVVYNEYLFIEIIYPTSPSQVEWHILNFQVNYNSFELRKLADRNRGELEGFFSNSYTTKV